MFVHVDRAHAALQSGDQGRASVEYKSFLADAIHRIANARAAGGDWDNADESFKEALTFANEDSTLQLDYASFLFDRDKLAEARSFARSVLDHEPENARAEILLGRVSFEQKQYSEAARFLEGAAGKGELGDFWGLLALTYLRMQHLSLAQSLLEKAHQILGDNPSSRVRIATIIAIADYDNDGLPDIYVTGYGHNVLYHNLGGCKFEDVTERAHVAGGGFSVGAAWADYDRDGHLDLFVSRYVHSDIHNLPTPGSPSFNYKGLPIEVPGTEGETSLLYHNRGDGTFEEVPEKAGLHNSEKRRGMGVTWADYDDGWPDLFVANDMDANYLYRNKGDGTFDDVGMMTGVALSSSENRRT